jgi:hypothetical protein
MRPEVLIIAGLYDFSIDLVTTRLDELAVPFLRLNREQLADCRISLDPIANSLRVRSGSFEVEIGPDLGAVFFRQPVFLRNTPAQPLTPAEQLSRSQWSAFQRGLCVFDQAVWMNHPKATYLAESKPYQLHVAHRCGLRVPATLATNDADAVHTTFFDKLVIKSLDTVLLREDTDCLFAYTTIGSSRESTDENTSAVPLLAQHVLQKKKDLRVTVVGGELFAVRILADGTGIEGDWRTVPRDLLTYEDLELDRETRRGCFKLVEELGLKFAAIDLVETPEGIFFIEVNPTGEWSWLNTQSRAIDLAIAKWLSNFRANLDEAGGDV